MPNKTVAFLTRDIYDGVGFDLMSGIIEGCRKHGLNLIIFDGDKLGGSGENIIYNLIGSVDGIISWASTQEDKYSVFYDNFKHIPIITLTAKIKDFPFVSINNYSGMKKTVEHLIKAHNYTKIAFIHGPKDHIYAKQRFQAYCDALTDNNIIIDKNLQTDYPANWEPDYGIRSIKYFFDDLKLKPGKDIEAIVGVNDGIIIAAYYEMQNRNIHVPEEIAIAGFNNIIEGQSLFSSLTTVEIPVKEQAEKSVDLMISIMSGYKTDPENNLECYPVIRESCGCLSNFLSVFDEEDNNKQVSDGIYHCLNNLISRKRNKFQNITISFNKLFDESISEIESECRKKIEDEEAFEGIIMNVQVLLSVFYDEINGRKKNEFMKILKTVILKFINKKYSLDLLFIILFVFKKKALSNINTVEASVFIQNLYEQSVVFINNVSNKIIQNASIEHRNKQTMLRDFGTAIATSLSIDEIKGKLEKWLNTLGIYEFYLMLYENPGNYAFMQDIPEQSKVIFAVSGGKVTEIKSDDELFMTKDIIPGKLKFDPSYYLISPLSFKNSLIGYMVFKNCPVEKFVYNVLTKQLSSTLSNVLLLNKQASIEKKLEDALNKMNEKAVIVTNNSLDISTRVEDVSATMEQMASNVMEISNRISDVMDIVEKAVLIANNANDIITQLKDKLSKIGGIINVITDVAQKTNILSLNTNIEAARAREAGKGFSIIAREIKLLSQETVRSAESIKSIVGDMQNNSKNTNESLDEIVIVINKISDLASIIKSAITEHSVATSDISNKLIKTSEGSREIYQAVAELAALGRNKE